jgi:hypothetical protein
VLPARNPSHSRGLTSARHLGDQGAFLRDGIGEIGMADIRAVHSKEYPMVKANLVSMSVEALLQLHDDIGNILSQKYRR